MNVPFPEGWRVEGLATRHNRKNFDCGEPAVNRWFRQNARQSQEKNLSSTKILLDEHETVAGYYTLAFGHVHLDQLPHELARKLPRQLLPIVTLAWLGVDKRFHGQGIGDMLTAHALLQCHAASSSAGFVAVVIDCVSERAKAFFQRFDFIEFPGRPLKLLLPKALLDAMIRGS